jgi:hypothetical protein
MVSKVSAAIVALTLLFTGVATSCSNSSSSTRVTTGVVYRVNIPVGTYDQVMRGILIDLIPRRLTVHVGDEFVIVNNDVVTHVVGPFTVRSAETFRYFWTKPGTITGECTIRMNETVEIKVLE